MNFVMFLKIILNFYSVKYQVDLLLIVKIELLYINFMLLMKMLKDLFYHFQDHKTIALLFLTIT